MSCSYISKGQELHVPITEPAQLGKWNAELYLKRNLISAFHVTSSCERWNCCQIHHYLTVMNHLIKHRSDICCAHTTISAILEARGGFFKTCPPTDKTQVWMHTCCVQITTEDRRERKAACSPLIPLIFRDSRAVNIGLARNSERRSWMSGGIQPPKKGTWKSSQLLCFEPVQLHHRKTCFGRPSARLGLFSHRLK